MGIINVPILPLYSLHELSLAFDVFIKDSNILANSYSIECVYYKNLKEINIINLRLVLVDYYNVHD